MRHDTPRALHCASTVSHNTGPSCDACRALHRDQRQAEEAGRCYRQGGLVQVLQCGRAGRMQKGGDGRGALPQGHIYAQAKAEQGMRSGWVSMGGVGGVMSRIAAA